MSFLRVLLLLTLWTICSASAADSDKDETVELYPCVVGYQLNKLATQKQKTPPASGMLPSFSGLGASSTEHENLDADGNRFNYVYDLSPLIRQVGSQDFSVTQGGFKYNFNFCANTLSNGNCWLFTPAWMTMLGGACNTFGDLGDMSFRPIDGSKPELGVILRYNNPKTSCSLDILVHCDPNEADPGRITTVEPYNPAKSCISSISFVSPHGCPAIFTAVGGISVGSIILIILACLLFVYILGGFIYNWKIKKEELSWRCLPNVDFWIALPGLVKDGTMFIVDKIKACTNRGGGDGPGYNKL